MTDVALIASWIGYCADCHADDRRLLLVQRGPRGVRAWLAGVGPDNRSLSYCCSVCGRVEFVPATEAEDRAYDLALPRWPDWATENDPLTLPRRGTERTYDVVADVWDDLPDYISDYERGYEQDVVHVDAAEELEDDDVPLSEFAVSVTDVLPPTARPVMLFSAARSVPAQRRTTVQVRSGVAIEVQPGGRVAITDGPLPHVA